MTTIQSGHAPSTLLDANPPMRGRLDYVDGLRAILALLVVIHHEWLTVFPFYTNKILPTGALYYSTIWLLTAGRFAVVSFIVISGFSLMLPMVKRQTSFANVHQDGGARAFIKKRAWRILPPYYAALATSLVLAKTVISKQTGTQWDVSIPVTSRDILAHVLMLQNFRMFSNESAIDHPLWSISVEWWIYICFPLLLVCWRKIGPARTIASLFVTIVSLRALAGWAGVAEFMPHGYNFILLFMFGAFASSAAFGIPLERVGKRTSQQVRARYAFIGAVVCGVIVCGWHNGAILIDFLWGIASALLLYSLVVGNSEDHFIKGLASMLSSRPLVALGISSYSLYLIHAPVVQTAWQVCVKPHHIDRNLAFLVLLATTPLTLLISRLFFVIAERPFLHGRAPDIQKAFRAFRMPWQG